MPDLHSLPGKTTTGFRHRGFNLRNRCLNYEVAYLTAMGLSNIAKRLYLHMFRVESAPLEFFAAFHDYLDD